ncbi:hypothetical protein EVAR_52821_1 [Eumeta japonica]|uniref:Uncharacterized protein n=1 Tax=Eumeta variegata TaxID=151549 RepID=A0A4C1YG29_EUMVA|nr:hypothetical protein EVAR_52821_1 [Eumeta japonica]
MVDAAVADSEVELHSGGILSYDELGWSSDDVGSADSFLNLAHAGSGRFKTTTAQVYSLESGQVSSCTMAASRARGAEGGRSFIRTLLCRRTTRCLPDGGARRGLASHSQDFLSLLSDTNRKCTARCADGEALAACSEIGRCTPPLAHAQACHQFRDCLAKSVAESSICDEE